MSKLTFLCMMLTSVPSITFAAEPAPVEAKAADDGSKPLALPDFSSVTQPAPNVTTTWSEGSCVYQSGSENGTEEKNRSFGRKDGTSPDGSLPASCRSFEKSYKFGK